MEMWSSNNVVRSPSHDLQKEINGPEAPLILIPEYPPLFVLKLRTHTKPFDFLSPYTCRSSCVKFDLRCVAAVRVVCSRHKITRLDLGDDTQPAVKAT